MRFDIISSRRILDDFFKIEEAQVRYERFDGTMTDPVRRLNFERGDSVAAILEDPHRQEVILVRQFRYPTCGKGTGWVTETVAGMLGADETPEAAIRREIEEEAGYRIEDLVPISTFFVSPGGTSERIILFFAQVDSAGQIGAGSGDDAEDIEVQRFPLDALAGMLERGEIEDAKTIIGLQWLLARNAAKEKRR